MERTVSSSGLWARISERRGLPRSVACCWRQVQEFGGEGKAVGAVEVVERVVEVSVYLSEVAVVAAATAAAAGRGSGMQIASSVLCRRSSYVSSETCGGT